MTNGRRNGTGRDGIVTDNVGKVGRSTGDAGRRYQAQAA